MSTGGPEETNEKLISNFSQNEIESKCAEFKILAARVRETRMPQLSKL